jgi:hypothetical protein
VLQKYIIKLKKNRKRIIRNLVTKTFNDKINDY